MTQNLFLSLTHAVIQSVIVLPDLWYNPPWKMDPAIMIYYTSLKIQFAHFLFLFYIILDSYKHYSKLKLDEWFHHIMTFVGVSTSLYHGPHYIGYCCLANEFSTIFLHLRHYVKYKLACKICFLLTFTIFRIGLNLYLLYWTLKYVGIGLPFTMQIIPYLINIWWYKRILSIALNYNK